MYNRFCVKKDVQLDIGRGFNSVSRRNTQEARGAPAKGVGRVTGARVQIPLSPFLFYEM